jgi:hypothetical protein
LAIADKVFSGPIVLQTGQLERLGQKIGNGTTMPRISWRGVGFEGNHEERWLAMVCKEKRQLLADFVERIQALAIEAELFLEAADKNSEEDLDHRWFLMERAKINCDIARLALGSHTTTHGC